MIFDEDMQQTETLGRALELMRSIWAVDHAMRSLSRVMEARLGVSGPQRLVVRVVAKRPGIGAGELAALLHLDASTLTAHLTKLEEGGLLDRYTSEEDRRRTRIYLTAKGRRLDVAAPGTVEAAVDEVLGGMSAEAVPLIEEFLERLTIALATQAAQCETRPARRRR